VAIYSREFRKISKYAGRCIILLLSLATMDGQKKHHQRGTTNLALLQVVALPEKREHSTRMRRWTLKEIMQREKKGKRKCGGIAPSVHSYSVLMV
jgi:hypothetical protein